MAAYGLHDAALGDGPARHQRYASDVKSLPNFQEGAYFGVSAAPAVGKLRTEAQPEVLQAGADRRNGVVLLIEVKDADPYYWNLPRRTMARI